MASIPFTGRTERSKGSWESVLPLLPIAFSVFMLSALTWYRIQGYLGESLLAGAVVSFQDFLGFEPACMFCLLVLAWSSIWFFTARIEAPGSRILKILALTLCLSILVNLKADSVVSEQNGIVGAWLAGRMKYVFGFGLSSLLVAGVCIVFLWLATDSFFYSYFEGIGRGPSVRRDVFEDEGVEAATVQAFESLADQPPLVPAPLANGRERRRNRAEGRAARRLGRPEGSVAEVRRGPSTGRPTLVLEQDPLDRVFPGPVSMPGADSCESESLDPSVEVEFEAEEIPEEQGRRGADVADIALDAEDEAEEPSEIEDSKIEEYDAADEEDEEDVECEAVDSEDEEGEYEAEDEDDEEVLEYEDDDEEGVECEEEGSEVEDYDDEGDAEVVEYEEEGSEVEDESDAVAEGRVEPSVEEEGSVEEEPSMEEDVGAAGASTVILPRPSRHPSRQGSLFPGPEGDQSLVDEAARLVIETHRASAGLLRRRLRITRQDALGVIRILSEYGVIECEEGAALGHVVMDLQAWEARSR